jgi:hypothetical protein
MSFTESNPVEQMILDAAERGFRLCAPASLDALAVVNNYGEVRC